ncbi:uncharacterized protein LOC134803051 [Cydia splendana]|uniref:uncharacterized protein LOC134803051 n=1 Tax=Cydia splendana TaxID=1100963 RepID=UPI00300D9025
MAIALVLLFIKTCACITVPVILIDPQAVLRQDISKNPFKDMSSDHFASLALDAIHKGDGVLIFVEEKLSVEDIASKDKLGNPYRHIQKTFVEDKAKYIPRVIEPFRTLEKVLPPRRDNVMIAATYLRLNDRLNYQYIYFEGGKVNETRVQTLRRHDDFIKDAYLNFCLKRKGPVIAFYTGKSNPMLDPDRRYKPPSPSKLDSPSDTVMLVTDQALIRLSVFYTCKSNPMLDPDRRYKRPSPSKRDSPFDTVMLVTDQALIRLSEVVHHEGPKRTHLIGPRASTRRFARRRASTRVFYDGDFELDFNFEYLRDGWLLDSVVLLEDGEEVGRTPMGVGAPYDWSYFCSEPLIIGNSRDKSYVSISKYQVEPLQINSNYLKLQDPPAPDGDAPAPGGDGPAPGGDEPAPGGDAPAPGGDAPAPGGDAPAPGGDAPAPGGDAPPPPPPPPPPPADGGSDKTGFTNTQSCGTNFNCHILAGLFVAFLVISITFCGIIVLYDCKSNDRMDDPTQKPLVIVAQL